MATVSLNERGRPLRVKLSRIAGFTNVAVTAWATQHLVPGTTVTSDGLALAGFHAVSKAG